jgi:hypothetical protein
MLSPAGGSCCAVIELGEAAFDSNQSVLRLQGLCYFHMAQASATIGSKEKAHSAC